MKKCLQDKRQDTLNSLNKKITRCKKCPRLAQYISHISTKKTKRFFTEQYWGKPVPSLGDVNARLLIIGLAPAAHGGNRTGRMFTGDSSGDWLTKVLYNFGFANKPTSNNIDDGLQLSKVYVTASVRCAPPENKPAREELENCFPYLQHEIQILKEIKVIICLGRIAFDTCCKLLHIHGVKFSHGISFNQGDYTVICSYHPSRQNTQTGRLSWKEWSKIFTKAAEILEQDHETSSSDTNIQRKG